MFDDVFKKYNLSTDVARAEIEHRERSLWRHVLFFLMRDLQKSSEDYCNSTNGVRQDLYQKQHRLLSLVDDDWIMRICEFAEIPHFKFRAVCYSIVYKQIRFVELRRFD